MEKNPRKSSLHKQIQAGQLILHGFENEFVVKPEKHQPPTKPIENENRATPTVPTLEEIEDHHEELAELFRRHR